MRDYASVEQLLVLANMESYNSTLIEEGLSQQGRIVKLNDMARNQIKVLTKNNIRFNDLLTIHEDSYFNVLCSSNTLS